MSNLFKMQIFLQVGLLSSLHNPQLIQHSPFFSFFLLLINPSCYFQPNKQTFSFCSHLSTSSPSCNFIIGYSALLLLTSEATLGNLSFSVPIQIFLPTLGSHMCLSLGSFPSVTFENKEIVNRAD